MAKKRVQLYPTESVLEEFFKYLMRFSGRGSAIPHIPKSDVFYIRRAIYEKTGKWYTLDHVERSMYVEGHLTKYEVLDPDRKRQFVEGQAYF